MSNRLRLLILAMSTSFLPTTSLLAFAQKAPPEPKTIADSINYIWHDVEHDFTALAEAMPEQMGLQADTGRVQECAYFWRAGEARGLRQ